MTEFSPPPWKDILRPCDIIQKHGHALLDQVLIEVVQLGQADRDPVDARRKGITYHWNEKRELSPTKDNVHDPKTILL
jgi:hypothetical protein